MKTPSLKTLLRVIGVVLLFFAGFFLFFSFCIALGAKGDSVSSTVGHWPLFGFALLALSVFFLLGAPYFERLIQRRHSDKKHDHVG